MLPYTHNAYFVELDVVSEPHDIPPAWRNTESLSDISPVIMLWTGLVNIIVNVTTIFEARFIIHLSMLSAIFNMASTVPSIQ